MLRMAPFQLETPGTVEEAVALLAQHGARAKVLAGGTDVVPNMKHGLHEPEVVVSIGRIGALRGITAQSAAAGPAGAAAGAGGLLEIGALTTLHDIEHSEVVRQLAPGLARAAALVAGPQLRRMGTLGGNLCLDTRCLYYNQTYFWREALGFCLKKDGTVCHVVAGGKKCVAAASNDTATMLLCLDAEVDIQSPAGVRTVKLEDFFVADGAKNTVLEPGDLLVRVRVPVPPHSARGAAPLRLEGYAKLRHRNAIDFPLLSVGVRFDLGDGGAIEEARLVVSALGARPNRVNLDAWRGKALDDTAVKEIAALAFSRCSPLTNIADDPAWRKDMVPVYVRRAIEDARARAAHVA
jgi:4-hydroxybenzoyl-CoA reductase subunit beta